MSLRGHMLNIVTIEGQRYMIDVGFGSGGPSHPMPLTHDQVSTNVGQQTMHLIKGPIADLTDSSQELWQYEYCNGPDMPWIPAYCFTETEFTPDDFMVMNHFTSTSRTSLFNKTVICVKMIMQEDEIVGHVSLNGVEVNTRIRGKPERTATCTSEDERIEVLDRLLGVKLGVPEREGIRGLITEIR